MNLATWIDEFTKYRLSIYIYITIVSFINDDLIKKLTNTSWFFDKKIEEGEEEEERERERKSIKNLYHYIDLTATLMISYCLLNI